MAFSERKFLWFNFRGIFHSCWRAFFSLAFFGFAEFCFSVFPFFRYCKTKQARGIVSYIGIQLNHYIDFVSIRAQCGKWKNYIFSLKQNSSNWLFGNFFSKTVTFTKFLPKESESTFRKSHCAKKTWNGLCYFLCNSQVWLNQNFCITVNYFVNSIY